MPDGIKRTYSFEVEKQGADHRDAEVDQSDLADQVDHSGHEFGALRRQIEDEQLQAANAQERQHQDRQRDEAETPEPDQQPPPHQQPGRRIVETDDNRRAGGADSRHGFEYCVRV